MTTEATATTTDTIDFEVTVTATNGVQIPLQVVVTYPEGYGFYAAKALQAMPDNMDGIWNDLIHRQDASTIKVMLESGHAQGGDE